MSGVIIIVELSGQFYDKPMEKMVSYLYGMDASVGYNPKTEIPPEGVLCGQPRRRTSVLGWLLTGSSSRPTGSPWSPSRSRRTWG